MSNDLTFAIVKYACLILSLLVLLLSVKPCCEDEICLSDYIPANQYAGKKAPVDKNCSDCSPFFSCGACTGFIVARPVTHTLSLLPAKPVKYVMVYRQPFLKEVTLTIWQPPKVG
jgi:hypothetical protein